MLRVRFLQTRTFCDRLCLWSPRVLPLLRFWVCTGGGGYPHQVLERKPSRLGSGWWWWWLKRFISSHQFCRSYLLVLFPTHRRGVPSSAAVRSTGGTPGAPRSSAEQRLVRERTSRLSPVVERGRNSPSLVPSSAAKAWNGFWYGGAGDREESALSPVSSWCPRRM